jgi:hypothetical protein
MASDNSENCDERDLVVVTLGMNPCPPEHICLFQQCMDLAALVHNDLYAGLACTGAPELKCYQIIPPPPPASQGRTYRENRTPSFWSRLELQLHNIYELVRTSQKMSCVFITRMNRTANAIREIIAWHAFIWECLVFDATLLAAAVIVKCLSFVIPICISSIQGRKWLFRTWQMPKSSRNPNDIQIIHWLFNDALSI